MKYTTEESAMLCGVLSAYFCHESVSPVIRLKHQTLCERIAADTLEQIDYMVIVDSLNFILGSHSFEPSENKFMECLLAKTIALSKK